MLRLTERLEKKFNQHEDDESDSITEARSISLFVTRILNTRVNSCNIRPEMGFSAFDSNNGMSGEAEQQGLLNLIQKQIMEYDIGKYQ